MNPMEDLLQRFIDDPDGLADDQLAALVELLRDSPASVCELKDQLLIAEIIGQQLAVDRQDFIAQVQQRIRDESDSPRADAEAPVDATDELVREMQQLADHELAATQEQRFRRRRRSWLVWAGALSLLIACGAAGWWYSQTYHPLANAVDVDGEPTLVRDGISRALRRGDVLRIGDQLVALPQESATLRYADGTQIRLLGDTSLRLGSTATGKRLVADWGTLQADVAAQPVGRPFQLETPTAEATVLGTQFWMSVNGATTRLDVIQGAVALTRSRDKAKVTVRSGEYGVAGERELAVKSLSWPVDTTGLVVQLENADPAGANVVYQGEEKISLVPQRRGLARPDRNFALVLGGGSCELPPAKAPLLAACRATGELTIEVTIQPDDLRQSGPARIVTFSADSKKYNFMLGQERHWLVFRLATSEPARGDERVIELVQLKSDRPQHIVVSYRPGELAAYADGRRVFHDTSITGDFSTWRPYRLALGDEATANRGWSGTLEGLACYDRFMELHEARRNAEQYRQRLWRRPGIPQIEFVGTLVESPPPPTPQGIAPAREALSVAKWRIDRRISGDTDEDEIFVAQWAVLDGKQQPPAELKPGDQRHLIVERLGVNPQLEGVPRFDAFREGDDPDRPRYYEISRP